MTEEPCVNCNEIFVIPQRPKMTLDDFDMFEKMRWKAYSDGIHMCKDCFNELCNDGVKEAIAWTDKWG